MDVCFCECFVLSGCSLCDARIPSTEESYEYLSAVVVVFYPVEVCATGWSLIQRSPIDVSLL